tara:strand:+ start:846 stop:1433 length:588 start_codon:yes stop_codon:yes gene_type:complete
LTTTPITTPTTQPVLTSRGVRIPKVGTIAVHPALGFCTVISRTHSSLRLTVDDIDGADDVTLRDGSIVSRADWMQRVSEASLNSACIEIAGLEARKADREDAFHGATAFVKELSASLEARVRDVNEMVISIDQAEACGWEFDEFATFTPSKNIKKAKAPKPVTVTPPVEEVDDAMPSWMADEVGECFADDAVWTA